LCEIEFPNYATTKENAEPNKWGAKSLNSTFQYHAKYKRICEEREREKETVLRNEIATMSF
jgi:hypothetical protein